MKHCISLIIALLIAIISISSCNSGKWDSQTVEDNTENVKISSTNYTAKDGSVVAIVRIEQKGQSDEYVFGVTTAKGLFDFNYFTGTVSASIDFYEGRTLIDKKIVSLEPSGGLNTAEESTDCGKDVYDHLMQKGGIRVIIPRSGMDPFDLKVPKYSQMK